MGPGRPIPAVLGAIGVVFFFGGGLVVFFVCLRVGGECGSGGGGKSGGGGRGRAGGRRGRGGGGSKRGLEPETLTCFEVARAAVIAWRPAGLERQEPPS